jgi:hypothetical protein
MTVAASRSASGFVPEHAERCLKRDGRRSVWLTRPPGSGPVTLKLWPAGPVMILKLLLGIAQPQRQVRGQRRLAAAGIDSPAPRGACRLMRAGPDRVVALELDFVDGRAALDVVTATADGAAAERRHGAAALGRLVAAHARAGLFNRDLKLSNVILAGDDPNAAAIAWVLDPVGVRRRRRSEAEIERMLERLAIEPIDRGIAIPRDAAVTAVRAALRPFPRETRRGVLRRLRARRRP